MCAEDELRNRWVCKLHFSSEAHLTTYITIGTYIETYIHTTTVHSDDCWQAVVHCVCCSHHQYWKEYTLYSSAEANGQPYTNMRSCIKSERKKCLKNFVWGSLPLLILSPHADWTVDTPATLIHTPIPPLHIYIGLHKCTAFLCWARNVHFAPYFFIFEPHVQDFSLASSSVKSLNKNLRFAHWSLAIAQCPVLSAQS